MRTDLREDVMAIDPESSTLDRKDVMATDPGRCDGHADSRDLHEVQPALSPETQLPQVSRRRGLEAAMTNPMGGWPA